jgi:hypothetical protein
MKILIITASFLFATALFAGGGIVVGVMDQGVKEAMSMEYVGRYGEVDVLSTKKAYFTKLNALKNRQIEIWNGDNVTRGEITSESEDVLLIKTEDLQDIVIYNEFGQE